MTRAYSYNGWLASPDPADFGGLDNSPIPGTDVRLVPGVQAGDVATVAFYVCAQINARVERARSPGCWGFNFRPNVNNPNEISCHGSATGWDYNAPLHPNGVKGTWTGAQKREIRKILAEVNNVVAWGEDFDKTTDGMHFEIRGTPDEVAAAAKIRALEDDFMAMSEADKRAFARMVAAEVWSYGIPVDAATRKTYGYSKSSYPAAALLRGADARGRAATKAAQAVGAAVTALRTALGR